MPLRLIVALGAALALNGQDKPIGKGVNFYSTEKEVALGDQLAKDFRQTHTPLDNASAHDYIEQMGARLARALVQPLPFHKSLRANYRFRRDISRARFAAARRCLCSRRVDFGRER